MDGLSNQKKSPKREKNFGVETHPAKIFIYALREEREVVAVRALVLLARLLLRPARGELVLLERELLLGVFFVIKTSLCSTSIAKGVPTFLLARISK